MTTPGDERPDHAKALEDAVDRLDEKVAEEHQHPTRPREAPKHGSPDEPPD
ncbi:hypothetical protein [Mycolicibacter terrae]|nr:hypothetical protein [Mycolicibacter terrae]SNV88012.1 Uncharacterised protein [Mycolicibacter terrae]